VKSNDTWEEVEGIGWRRRGGNFVYRGDFRLRLQSCMWQWHGIDDRHWHVWFRKADSSGGAVHRRFSIAVLKAVVETYRCYWNLK